MSNKRIPRKKGQPANSDKHSDLYTDEHPKGTIHGLKFATPEDAKSSVAKIKKSGRSHAHKIQAAIAMEQRARVMGKAGAAAVYRKFINAMKQKTKEKNESLWDNIRKRRASGKRKLRPGDKNYPKTLDIEAKNEMMTTADAGIPQDTKTMGPKLKTTYMHDRRRKKSELPVLLKRFRKYMEDDSK